ncbi:MAG: type VII toxin-antitoxin system HepT family RNase toxin [Candidatus Njordarchaeales archaeon]|nr:MAG: hypothetical protein DRQ24_12580 [Candidatus Latescibacterota bacterium]
MADLLKKLEYIKDAIRNLDNLISREKVEDVIRDFIYVNSILHILQTSIQALIDIGTRVISELGERPPDIYREVAFRLASNNFLKKDEAILLAKIIGFRNILVHTYIGVNLNLVKEILEKRKYRDLLNLALKIVEKAQEKGIDP